MLSFLAETAFYQCRQSRDFKQMAASGENRKMDKIAMLNELLAQDPANAFARYGLAMEYAGRGETETSLNQFARLLELNPDYTAGYFMAAQTLAKAGRNEEAKSRLAEGIASARRTGNQHAQSEMQAMLDEIELAD
jgi:thioredoxin-like negative regulator of GroEL